MLIATSSIAYLSNNLKGTPTLKSFLTFQFMLKIDGIFKDNKHLPKHFTVYQHLHIGMTYSLLLTKNNLES